MGYRTKKKKTVLKVMERLLKKNELNFKPLNEEYNDGKSIPMYEQYAKN